MKRALVLILFALALANPARAQQILGIETSGEVYTVDPRTGATVFVGAAGPNFELWHSMARDSQGRVYAAYGSFASPYAIYEIDPNTGQATFVSQTALVGILGLAFGPGDVLYAINDRTTPVSGGPEDLYVIDLATGNETLIGDTGMNWLNSIAFHNGELWAYDGVEYGLVKIDTATGLATDVNPQITGPFDLNNSLCFSDSGVLYLVNYALWTMDPVSGVASYVHNPRNFGGIYGGVEFLPGAEPPFAVWMQGVTDGPMQAAASGATPGGTVAFAFSAGTGGPTPIPAGQPCAGLTLLLGPDMALAGLATASVQGEASIGPAFVPRIARGKVRVQAVDLATCTASNRVYVSY